MSKWSMVVGALTYVATWTGFALTFAGFWSYAAPVFVLATLLSGVGHDEDEDEKESAGA
jgi:hypothetical protein